MFNMNKNVRGIVAVSALVSAFIIMMLSTMNFKIHQIAIMVLPIIAIVFFVVYMLSKIYFSMKNKDSTNN